MNDYGRWDQTATSTRSETGRLSDQGLLSKSSPN